MEQATSAVNWRQINGAKTPNQLRLWSYEALAHGADGIMFFQWRQSRGGAENFIVRWCLMEILIQAVSFVNVRN